jgi:hypothetical protein
MAIVDCRLLIADCRWLMADVVAAVGYRLLADGMVIDGCSGDRWAFNGQR